MITEKQPWIAVSCFISLLHAEYLFACCPLLVWGGVLASATAEQPGFLSTWELSFQERSSHGFTILPQSTPSTISSAITSAQLRQIIQEISLLKFNSQEQTQYGYLAWEVMTSPVWVLILLSLYISNIPRHFAVLYKQIHHLKSSKERVRESHPESILSSSTTITRDEAAAHKTLSSLTCK